MSESHNNQRLALVVTLFILALLAWDTVLIYPVKVLVVAFHEISHGAAAVLTGGSIERIEINANLGGVCYTRGGSRILTVSAGYLGSLLVGALLFLSAARTRHDREIAAVSGGVLLLITLIYIRSTFGFVSGIAFGALLLASGTYLSEAVNDVLISFIGLTSMLYAVIDIKEDLISRTVPGSDTHAMSQIIPLPPVAWGCLWGLASIAVAVFVVRAALRRAP